MNIRNRNKREEREEYMDALERQMADRREQMQLTLDRIEILGRQRKALKALRTFLPSFASRIPTEDTRELETATEMPMGPTPSEASEGPQEQAAEERPGFWSRLFGRGG
jgi:hypothetical protein